MADAATERPTEAVKPTETSTNGAETKTTEDKPTNGASDSKATEEKSEKTTNDDDRGEPDEFGRDRRGGGKRDRSNDRYERRDRNDRDRDHRGGRGGRGGRGARGGGRGFGRGRGGGNYNDRQRNVKTKFHRDEESSDAQEIRRQVEFYFSDSNLPIDKFLLEETGGPENKPFPLKTIHNFKRMRHFQPFSAIVEAVKGSDFLEVNDKDEVYRKEPLDTKFTSDVQKNQDILSTKSMKNSIYAKGFGYERTRTAFEIEEFFEPYGVSSVRLRRHADGTFKGSVFVEFVDEDTAKQFLEMEEKPKFEDKELEIMSKQAYVDMKSQAILEGTVKPKSPTRKGSYRRENRDRRGSFRGGDYKRKRNHDDDDDDVGGDNWRERRDKFQKSRGRGRDRSASRTPERSRSRSPYREDKVEKSEEKNGAEPDKTADATEGAKAEVEA